MSFDVMDYYEDNFTSNDENFNETFSNKTFSSSSATNETKYEMIEFPKDMLGFTAACAFIIAILGAIGKY